MSKGLQAAEVNLRSAEIAESLEFRDILDFDELTTRLRLLQMRGIYDEAGRPVRPYADAVFQLIKIYPPDNKNIGDPPEIVFPNEKNSEESPNNKQRRERLWTPQPTIYGDQLFIMSVVHQFLKNSVQLRTITGQDQNGLADLEGAVSYEWPSRGLFHVLPPIIEQHRFNLKDGMVDTIDLREQFSDCYVKDANGNLHAVSQETLRNYYVDHESCVPHLPVLNPQVALFDYGQRYSGDWEFQIICDGSHRIHYALEELESPITAIHVDRPDEDSLIPYYAMPRPFHPTTRLSSKIAEIQYPYLENDKIHLLNGLISKTAHYNWDASGMNVSSLRAQKGGS